MKIMKPVGFFAAGIVSVLLAGCFSPITVALPKTAETPMAEPFSVDIYIGKDGARAVAGPDAARIKGDIRNIIQLIVADDTGKIAAFDEVRRGSDNETAAELMIESVPFGKTYHFLLLMGHWERNYPAEAGDGIYEYTPNPPTLLAVGLKDQLITGNGKVTVTMWPIEVDTEFISNAAVSVEPVITGGNPGAVSLVPGSWSVKWNIQKAAGSGLTKLAAARAITGSGPLFKSVKTMVRDDTGIKIWDNAAVKDNAVTLNVAGYTSMDRLGKTGSANFNLEYVPFSLNTSDVWKGISSQTIHDDGLPVWIIRNGINDEAQDDKTSFAGGVKWGETVNGNGAVVFTVTVDTLFIPPDSDIILEIPETKEPPVVIYPVDIPDEDRAVTWTSDDGDVATVDANTGVVTAVGPGEAGITGTLVGSGPVQKVSYTVTVPGVRLKLTGGQWLNKLTPRNKLDLIKNGGSPTAITAVVYDPYTEPAVTAVSWAPASSAVVTLSGGGNNRTIAPQGSGTETITASASFNDKTYMASCAVTVTVPVTGVFLSSTILNLESDETPTLTAAVLPDNATIKTVTWSSDNPSVATVDANGMITTHALGTAVITATTQDGGYMASCTVKIAIVIHFPWG